jgi:hypothetical protein
VSRLDLLAGWDDEDQEQVPRKDGPRTEARIEAIDRALLYVFQLSGKDYEKMRNWRSAEALIAALEQDGWTVAEAAAGPRDNDRDERIRQLVYDHTAHVLGSTDRNGLAISLIEAAAGPRDDGLRPVTRWHVEAAIERLNDSIESFRATGEEPNVLTDVVSLLEHGLAGKAPGLTARGYAKPFYGTPTTDSAIREDVEP